MDKYHLIDSQFSLGARLPSFTQDEIKNEPMFFSATPRFAYENGGPITKAFLEAVTLSMPFGFMLPSAEGKWRHCFDSRVHMLMPGWWPCIPGWHHDDVPRSRSDGQPNYDNPEYKSKHCLALVNGDICPTEFAVGVCAYPDVPLGRTVYEDWHPQVENDIREGVLERVRIPSNQLVFFNNHSWHQGTQAIGRGFRWFGRLSWNAGYEQGRPHHNEIRRQVNVYLDMPMKGW